MRNVPLVPTIVVTSSIAGTLVVLDRDVTTGETTVRQVIKNGDGDVRGLDGALGVAFSPDGQFAYTSAGRFRGDSVVGVYKFDEAGQLSLVQEIVNAEDDLPDFVGGNEITVSADGRIFFTVHPESRPQGNKLLEWTAGAAVPTIVSSPPSDSDGGLVTTVQGAFQDVRDFMAKAQKEDGLVTTVTEEPV